MGIGASRSATDLFELSGRDGTLYASVSGDNAFHIKGINWFGSETYCGPPGGLDRHPVGFYLDFLQRHKFNAIRLLFAHEFIEKDDIVHTAESEDPLFFQTRYLEMFTILCREAAKRGMLVMVAAHRLRHDAWPGKGLWYDDDIGWPVSRVKTSWSKLAAVLCGEWNVIAAECASRHLERVSNALRPLEATPHLLSRAEPTWSGALSWARALAPRVRSITNEPHGASWAKGLAIDWNLGAEDLGDHVLRECPRWLIFVEGVGYNPGAPNGDDPGAGIWWGENLIGARVQQVMRLLNEPLMSFYNTPRMSL